MSKPNKQGSILTFFSTANTNPRLLVNKKKMEAANAVEEEAKKRKLQHLEVAAKVAAAAYDMSVAPIIREKVLRAHCKDAISGIIDQIEIW